MRKREKGAKINIFKVGRDPTEMINIWIHIQIVTYVDGEMNVLLI
jgi:hypothetical protein